MPSRLKKIDLSIKPEGELYSLGISSASGVAVIASQFNRYLDIELSLYSKLNAIAQNTVVDSLPMFTTFEPKENEVSKEEDFDFFDLRLGEREPISKYLLIQCRGERTQLFPKISPLDFLFISNYSIEYLQSSIRGIPEVTITFPIGKEHLGKRYEYFRKLLHG